MDAGVASTPDGYSLCILMRGYGAQRQLRPLVGIWQRMVGAGLVDPVAMNTYLFACAQCSDVPRALQAFQMAKVDLPRVAAAFDIITFGTLIDALVYGDGSATACNRGAPRALVATCLRLFSPLTSPMAVPCHIQALATPCKGALTIPISDHLGSHPSPGTHLVSHPSFGTHRAIPGPPRSSQALGGDAPFDDSS